MGSTTNSAETKNIILFAPGLRRFRVEQIRQMIAEPQSLKELDLLYSRANLQAGSAKSIEATLFNLFGIVVDESKDLPVAALTDFLVNGESLENRWFMRADPVYIQPNRDHLLMMGNTELEINMQEAENIVSDINNTYSDQSWKIKAVTPKQWVLEQDQEENLQTQSPFEVAGKNINDFLPKGDNDSNWRALMNELQMFLHNHPVNQQRQMQGLSIANSLWFWGCGKLPTLSSTEKIFAQCWSNETVSLALARLSGVPRTDLPESASDWLKQAITPGKHLVFVETLSYDFLHDDPVAWWRSLVAFNSQWIAPLIDALKANTVEDIKVMDDNGDFYYLNRQLLSRWWRLFGRN